MKPTFFLTLAACGLLIAGGASAEPSFRPYVGLEYNYLGADVKVPDLDGNGTADFTGEPFADSYHAVVPNIGARIGKYAGVEFGYLHSTEEGQSVTGADALAGLTGNIDTEITGWHVDVNGYIPVTEKLEAIGSVGIGDYEADASITGTIAGSLGSDSDTAFRAGAGLQYGFNEHLSLRGMVRYIDAEFESGGVTLADGAWVGALGVNYAF